jgi:methyl-accepting chemotaxis protein
MALTDLTIRTKLIIAFSLILFFTMGLGLFAVERLSQVRAVGAEMRNEWLPATRALGIAAQSAERLRAGYASLLAVQTDEARTYYTGAIGKGRADLLEALRIYGPLISSGEEKRLSDKVTETWQAYEEAGALFQSAVAAKDTAKALELLTTDISKTSVAFRTALQDDLSFNLRGGQEAADRGDQLGQSANMWILIVLAIMLILCIGVCLSLIRGISAPIAAMTKTMRVLAENDVSVSIPGIGRGDEIGAMALAVQVFKDNMIEARRLTAAEATATEATIERAQQLATLTRSFEAQVGNLVQGVSSAATELEATARSMSSIAEQGNLQASIVASASEETSVNVQTVASATEQLSSSVEEIGRQVQESSRIAGQAVDTAKQVDVTVQTLADDAQKIGAVVTLIQNIAAQTNLLALNATIEAARAGEAGKGFAVVASEVKSLANQTAKATTDIAQQIAAIQDATTGTVSAIRGIIKTIGEINEIATSIASSVEEQGAATKEIARNVAEAARGTQEVSSSITGVRETATATGDAASQVLGAARELSQQAESLTGQVSQFIAAVKVA